MRKRHFSVMGRGNFPFECLAADQCFPATNEDAEAIRMSCPTVADLRAITFATYQRDTPNPQRWKDAGWPVQWVET